MAIDQKLQEEIDAAFAELNPQQAEFVRFYCKQGCGNGAEAADKAGFCPTDKGSSDPKIIAKRNGRLASSASKLLAKENVKHAINMLMRQANDECIVDMDWWLKSCKEMHDKCSEVVPVMERDENGDLVESGVFKFDSSGAGKALDMIGKHLGAYAAIEHKHSIDETLEDVLNNLDGRTTGLPGG